MKNKVKKLSSLLAVVVYIILFIGSATQQNVSKPTLKVATYDFVPPSTAPVNSAKITLLLVHPQYAKKFAYSDISIFNKFSQSMSEDFNEMLIAKGYTVRGPFPIYDNIIYSDKKESNLLLEVEIDLDLNDSNVEWTNVVDVSSLLIRSSATTNAYKFKGNLVLSGKISLTLSEPFTREKLWAKNIPLLQKPVYVTSTLTYPAIKLYNIALKEDSGIINPLTNALEELYTTIFNTAWEQLNPNELKPLLKQVEEIRVKMNFN